MYQKIQPFENQGSAVSLPRTYQIEILTSLDKKRYLDVGPRFYPGADVTTYLACDNMVKFQT